MTQSNTAHSLLHMHGPDGAHPLLLAVVLMCGLGEPAGAVLRAERDLQKFKTA